jgi:thioredoxin-like negative regulator of GroEL
MITFFHTELKQSHTQHNTLPSFGRVKEITAEEFVDEVDLADPRVCVVVHLYESSVQGSVRMNRILEELAVSMPKVKFMRMNVSCRMILWMCLSLS